MIKAVFFDIDGTLISFRTHAIPQSTRQALEQLRAGGIKTFIATGRPRMLMEPALEGLEFDGYITLNGAHCFDASHQNIYTASIPQDDIERLIGYLHRKPSIPFVFVGRQEAFITSVDEAVRQVAELIEIDIPHPRPAEEARGKEILQLMGYFPQEQDEEIFGRVLLHCSPMRWHPLFADIIAQGTSKSSGIDRILAHYGIGLDESMAFGDGGNDIPMLRHAGIGVAMGNAADNVKAAARYVTTSVDEDGIANVLKHFHLI